MVRLIEKYLTEDIEAVKKQYSYIPEDEFNFIIQIDPTFNPNSNSVGKYGKWLLGLYKKHDTYLDDMMDCFKGGNKAEIEYTMNDIKGIIAKYDSYKNDRTKVIERDVMRFKSIAQMNTAIEEAGEAELSKKQAQRQAKKDKPYDMIFDGKTYAIFVPKNHEGDMILASFGGSSKAIWCTAADSDNGVWRYDYYLEKGGKYYVLINKNDYEDKYQFHFESDQFMNADNEEINLDEFWDENHDVLEFFQSIGYAKDWYEGKAQITEIVNNVYGWTSLGNAWNDIRPQEWELVTDFLNYDYSDEIYQIVKEVLPEFNNDISEEEINDFIRKVLLKKSESKTMPKHLNAALAANEITQIRINEYYKTFQGYNREEDVEETAREFLEYQDGSNADYTYNGYFDIDTFKGLLSSYCVEDFSPNVDYEDDDDYDQLIDNYSWDIQDADTDETYFCFRYGNIGAGKIKDVMKTFFTTFLCEKNLKNTISQFACFNFLENGDISGLFKDYPTDENFASKTWMCYKADPTDRQMVEYAGKRMSEFSDIATAGATYIQNVPFELIKKEVYTQKDLFEYNFKRAPFMAIFVSLDKTRYVYSGNEEWEKILDAWIEKLGLQDAKRCTQVDLAAYESYKKRLKLREK